MAAPNAGRRRWSRIPKDSIAPLADPAKTIIVFDFDCTLSSIHLFHTLRTQEGKQQHQENKEAFFLDAFGGQERLDALHKFISELHALGVPMVVMSFGVEEEIKPALKYAQIFDLFETIYDAFSYSKFGITSSSSAKADMLAEFTNMYGEKYNRFLFVDDDRGNFPARGLLGSECFDDYRLESASSSVVMYVYPVGDQKDGDGLVVEDFDRIKQFVVGDIRL
eukprot:c13544_g1_i1.p1 GENE.c13544_g1_i1~~c13544_g1_i1.p1  ORF type:complete len:240 (-),score=60.34 c13544_g1_i1:357-1022(-)